ncbi:MAG: class I SAM-dependent methyltransferase [Thermoleophilia bacterium]
MREEERIKAAYAKRAATSQGNLYSWFNPATALHLHNQERAVLALLARHGVTGLSEMRILEVGCGGGSEIANFLKYGARAENVAGVELLAERADACRRRYPGVDVRQTNAEQLPFADADFDIVCQFVMFSSILDQMMKIKIATEMRRVVKPGGLLIWYDYFLGKPGNRDVRGIGKKEIMRLFPSCRFDFRKESLAAPLNRLVAPRSAIAAQLLGTVPFLKSHYLVAIEKEAG